MREFSKTFLCFLCLLVAIPHLYAQPSPRAVIDKYCVTCHNERLKTAGLMLDKADVDHVGSNPETWEKVLRKLRAREMPPAGSPRPDTETYTAMSALLEKMLDDAASANPNPGRIAVHRLNRTEYATAIRDLLGLQIDGKAMLAADEADQEGFDNVASILSVSPVLLEGYLSAARTISRLAVADPAINPVADVFKIPTALVQDERTNEDLPFGSHGGTAIRYHFPLDGEYQIKVSAEAATLSLHHRHGRAPSDRHPA